MQISGGGHSLNDYLAAAAASNAALQLRTTDQNIRSQLQAKANAAGAGGTSSIDLNYTIGPDGQLYATSGTVTTSRRTQGGIKPTPNQIRTGQYQPVGAQDVTNTAANQNNPAAPARRLSFGDVLPPALSLSPLAFAELQEQQEPSQTRALQRLQLADSNVRNHENQHFFTAGGLVEGTPEFEFKVGPDGKLYAVAGHVSVSTTPTSDPEQASRDAAALSRAATAPGDTSAADLAAARGSLSNAASLYGQANNLGEPNILNLVA